MFHAWMSELTVVGSRPCARPARATFQLKLPAPVPDVEVHPALYRGADRGADDACFVEHALGACVVHVRDDVAAHQVSQDLIQRDGGVTGVNHHRLPDRVGYPSGPPKDLACVVRVWADDFFTDADLDTGYRVGIGTRDRQRPVDIRPANIFELADTLRAEGIVARHPDSRQMQHGHDAGQRDVDHVALEAWKGRGAG
jgi:hypothetical protein